MVLLHSFLKLSTQAQSNAQTVCWPPHRRQLSALWSYKPDHCDPALQLLVDTASLEIPVRDLRMAVWQESCPNSHRSPSAPHKWAVCGASQDLASGRLHRRDEGKKVGHGRWWQHLLSSHSQLSLRASCCLDPDLLPYSRGRMVCLGLVLPPREGLGEAERRWMWEGEKAACRGAWQGTDPGAVGCKKKVAAAGELTQREQEEDGGWDGDKWI